MSPARSILQAVPAEVVNTSGAGDSLVAGCLFGVLQGRCTAEAVAVGLVRAVPPKRALSNTRLRACCCCAQHGAC